MKISKILLLIVIACTSAALIHAGGSNDPQAPTPPKTVQVSGRVRLVVNEPFTRLVITNEDNEWQIDQKDQQKLWPLQQQLVTVKAKEYYQDLTFANGSPAGRQYFLKDIKIITPKP